MAYLPSGTSIENRITVRLSTTRLFDFSFPVTGAEDLRVGYTGPEEDAEEVELQSSLWRLHQLDDTGGQIRLFDEAEISVPPFVPAVNGVIRIYRSTPAIRRTALTGEAYARAATVDAALNHIIALLQEQVAVTSETRGVDPVIGGSYDLARNVLVLERASGDTQSFSVPLPQGTIAPADIQKLISVESGAQRNPDASTIGRLYESNPDRRPFTSFLAAKLASIQAGAQQNLGLDDLRLLLFGSSEPSFPLNTERRDKVDAISGETIVEQEDLVQAVAERAGTAFSMLAQSLQALSLEKGTEASGTYTVADTSGVELPVDLAEGTVHGISIEGYDTILLPDALLSTYRVSVAGQQLVESLPVVLAVDGVTSETNPIHVWFGRNAAGKLIVAFNPPGEYVVRSAAYTQKETAASALTEDQQRELDKVGNSIDWNSIDGARTAGDNVFELANNDGEEKTLDLPGISIFNDAALQGVGYQVWEIAFKTGSAFSVAVVGQKATVTIPMPQVGSTNYRTSQATTAEITMPVGTRTQQAWSHAGSIQTRWLELVRGPALPAANEGVLFLHAGLDCIVDSGATGGGERYCLNARIVRLRGGNYAQIMDKIAYGPRNINPPASPASTDFYDATRILDMDLETVVIAEEGDVYILEVRAVSQATPRAIGFPAGSQTMFYAQWAGVGGGTGGLDEAAVDLRVDHGIDAQVEDFAKTATADVMQRTQLATLMNGATADAQRISYDNLKDTPDPAAPQRASGIIPIAAVPSIVGFAVGTIEDVGGVLYELVDDDDEGNVLRGENAASEGGYRGVSKITGQAFTGNWADPALQAAVEWREAGTSLSRLRAQLPKMALGGSPPGSLGFRVVDDRGETTNIVAMRQEARDTSGADGVYGYASSLDGPVIDTPDGHSFTVTIFDETFTTPQKVHSEDRWELYENRQAGGLSKAAIENLISKIGIEPIYDHVKSILRAGRRTRITPTDANHLLTIEELPVPAGTDFPANPQIGDRFVLLHPDTFINDPTGTMYQAQATLRQMSLGGGVAGYPEALVSYPATYAGPSAATLRGNSYIRFRGQGAPAKTANRFWFYDEGQAPRSYGVGASTIINGLRLAQVTGLGYAEANNGAHHWNVGYTDGTKQVPDSSYSLGDYVWAGGNTGWEFAPGVAARWATQGQPEPKTQLAITTLISGAGIGLTVNDSSQDYRSGQLRGFSPTFNLNDADKMHGVIQVEAQLDLVNRASSTIGFTDETANPVTRILFKGWTLSSTVRRASAYLTGIDSAFHGVLIGEQDVRNGAGTLGVAKLWLGRDVAGNLGYFVTFEGSSGSSQTGFALALSNIESVFLHQDGPVSDPILSLTRRGRLVARSTALPQASVARTSAIGTIRTSGQQYPYLWNNRPAGYGAFVTNTNLNQPQTFFPPANPPSLQVSGLEFVSMLDGVVVQSVILPWGPAPLTNEDAGGTDDYSETTLFFRGGNGALASAPDDRVGSPARVRVRWTRTSSGYGDVQLWGDATTLPANCTIDVYESGVFAA